MKLARLSSLALAAAFALPVAAQAQTELLHFGGVKTPGGDQVGSAQTGPYVGLHAPFTPGTPFDIYCLDIDHTAQNVWTTRYLTFEEATTGMYSLQAQRQLGTEKSWGIAELRASAYLSTQFGVMPQSQWDEVHGSIWSMFSNNAAAASHSSLAAGALTIAGGNSQWDSYLLMVDNKVFADNYNAETADINQGFIVDDSDNTIRVITPEPGTYVLMGMGLFAVGFVRRRRNNA